MAQAVRGIIAGCPAWERLEMLDDDLDFRQREFALAGGGELRVDAAFARHGSGPWRLASMCATLDGQWSVDYACPDVYVRVHELLTDDRGCVQLRVLRCGPDPPDPFAMVPQPWCDRLRALHLHLRQLGAMADCLPILV